MTASSRQLLRVRISSPGDVVAERGVCRRVVMQLAKEFADVCDLQPQLWEETPCALTPAGSLPSVADAEIAIFVFANRIGTRLPDAVGAELTGTTFELQEAMRSFRERGQPAILIYWRAGGPDGTGRDSGAEVEEAQVQRRLLRDFLQQTLFGLSDSVPLSWRTFSDGQSLARQLEQDLRALMEKRKLLPPVPLAPASEPPPPPAEVAASRPRPTVFISAKSTDYAAARRVYDFLTAQEIGTFFSDESLPRLGNSDYRKEIDSALDAARHLVVVTSSLRNVTSAWVEAEWGFFVQEKRSGRKAGNLLTLVVGDLPIDCLPPSLRYYEVQRLSDDALPRILPYLKS